MKENNDRSVWMVIVIMIIIAWASFSMGAESKLDEIEGLEYEVEEYKYALQEANQQIEYAKYYTWESYEDMGNALENLTTVSP